MYCLVLVTFGFRCAPAVLVVLICGVLYVSVVVSLYAVIVVLLMLVLVHNLCCSNCVLPSCPCACCPPRGTAGPRRASAGAPAKNTSNTMS